MISLSKSSFHCPLFHKQILLEKKTQKQKKNENNFISNKSEPTNDDFEEVERELTVLTIQMSITKSIESLETLNEELNMLQQMQKVNFQPKKPENPPPVN